MIKISCCFNLAALLSSDYAALVDSLQNYQIFAEVVALFYLGPFRFSLSFYSSLLTSSGIAV